jgi:hypothetical protein
MSTRDTVVRFDRNVTVAGVACSAGIRFGVVKLRAVSSAAVLNSVVAVRHFRRFGL